MKLAKSTHYALCAAFEMAASGQAPVTVAHVAERYGIPASVLAKVLQQMVRSGLATGTRGARGGYRLARSAATITVLDVIKALESFPAPAASSSVEIRAPSPAAERTVLRLRELFDEVDELVRCTYASVSLATLSGRGSVRRSR